MVEGSAATILKFSIIFKHEALVVLLLWVLKMVCPVLPAKPELVLSTGKTELRGGVSCLREATACRMPRTRQEAILVHHRPLTMQPRKLGTELLAEKGRKAALVVNPPERAHD